MITLPQTLSKVRRLELIYGQRVYEPLESLAVSYLETDAHLRRVPDAAEAWTPCPAGAVWGRPWGSAWFRGECCVSAALAGKPLYLAARTGAVEAMFWLDGHPSGIFNYDPFIRNRGDHRAQLITSGAEEGRRFELAVEGYAGHPTPGSQPLDTFRTQGIYPQPFTRTFDRLELCLRNEAVNDFVLDLRALNQLSTSLSADSFRKGSIDSALARVFETVVQDPDHAPREYWLSSLADAREIMAPLLACRNGDSAPFAGLIGHSHLDSAWHWTLDEAIRKCARTCSNALRLMERYPEYRFVQSSLLHIDWMREHYPDIYAGIVQRTREGRWEPIGGAWVEPDVNLAGGEALIRHFLRGTRYAATNLGFRSDTFWLPDTFGYSAALPQILRGCGIEFFLTTKLSWNETNTFPYDTFWWEGIDGSRVLTHFNDIHCPPDPETLINKLHGTGPRDFRVVENCVRHKDVNNRRLISYGYGDGGGGPDACMIEIARRCADLEGCPRAEHVRVSDFMQGLRDHSTPPVFRGELYFEGHRGTLTQMHEIKRLNRRAEFALREAEFLAVRAGQEAMERARPRLHELWDLLLCNQFHDILPGTSIAEVHIRATRELTAVVDGAQSLAQESATALVDGAADRVTLFNSLSWTRGEAELSGLPAGRAPDGAGLLRQQVQTPWNETRIVLHGLELPPLGGRDFALSALADIAEPDPFRWDGTNAEGPHLRIRFDDNGSLASVVDRASGRELRRADGTALNRFLFGEDLPNAWDNWDIDADLERKLTPCLELESREVSGRGPLQLRIRQSFRFGNSRLVQDVVLHAHSARLDFETRIDWNEKHRFLAVDFDLDLRVSHARHEIQFGHLERPTHRNFAEDRARFEVCQHKWTDLSENRFGVALLNDGKYGVSVLGSRLRLSLHKGGCHPDPRGDAGEHVTCYSLLPHAEGFRAETVVRPAYERNLSPTWVPGALRKPCPAWMEIDAPNLVVETVKPAEDGNGAIVRIYECERSACSASFILPAELPRLHPVNLLEEPIQAIPSHIPPKTRLSEPSRSARFI